MSRSIEQPPPVPPPQSPSLSDHSFQNSNSSVSFSLSLCGRWHVHELENTHSVLCCYRRSVYSGSNSHRFMDPDDIEIPPPPPSSTHNSSNLLKQKQVYFTSFSSIYTVFILALIINFW